MAIFSFIMENLGGWAIGAVSLFIGGAGIYFKGRGDGRASEKIKQYEHQRELQNEYDEIDSRKPDFDNSIERLRDRK